jgi:hypothetical protein
MPKLIGRLTFLKSAIVLEYRFLRYLPLSGGKLAVVDPVGNDEELA